MSQFKNMPVKARAYWLLVVTAGFFWITLALSRWPVDETQLLRLLIFVVAAISSSGLKIRLPGIFGTLSMNYVVIFFSLLDSGIGVGLLVGLASTLCQCVLHPTSRPHWFQVLFSVAGIPLPVLAAAFVLRSPYLAHADHSGCIALLAASLVYMGVNTITVAGIIGLTTGKSLVDIWVNSYLWTYPQYLVGGAIAGGVHFLSGFLFSGDSGTLYQELKQPVWVVHGVRGDFVEYRGLRQVAERSNWAVEVLPTGALPHFEMTEEFVRRYDAWATRPASTPI